MHRPRWDSGNSNSNSSKVEVEGGSSTSVVSSQSLIMEDRPPGLPAKQTNEKVGKNIENFWVFMWTAPTIFLIFMGTPTPLSFRIRVDSHWLFFLYPDPVLRIRDVFPGSEFFSNPDPHKRI
jgi:hypothetical protein